MIATLLLWVLVVGFVGAFVVQVAPRVRLILAAPHTLSTDDLGFRVRRFLVDVVAQQRTIRERPVAGVAHAFVFWGFVAFGGYTTVEFLAGLGLVDLRHTAVFQASPLGLTPFAVAVVAGIGYLLVRRGLLRPKGLGATVSKESIVIGFFIMTLMVTFLLTWRLDERSSPDR